MSDKSQRTEKLQKILARSGHGSRREIEGYLQEGRISIDGVKATLGDRIDVTTTAKIRLDGRILSIREAQKDVCRVLAYYKPEGELCTRSDPQGRPTVFQRLPRLNHVLSGLPLGSRHDFQAVSRICLHTNAHGSLRSHVIS